MKQIRENFQMVNKMLFLAPVHFPSPFCTFWKHSGQLAAAEEILMVMLKQGVQKPVNQTPRGCSFPPPFFP